MVRYIFIIIYSVLLQESTVPSLKVAAQINVNKINFWHLKIDSKSSKNRFHPSLLPVTVVNNQLKLLRILILPSHICKLCSVYIRSESHFVSLITRGEVDVYRRLQISSVEQRPLLWQSLCGPASFKETTNFRCNLCHWLSWWLCRSPFPPPPSVCQVQSRREWSNGPPVLPWLMFCGVECDCASLYFDYMWNEEGVRVWALMQCFPTLSHPPPSPHPLCFAL